MNLPEGFKENTTGKIPRGANGKRVIVYLRNGNLCGVEPVTTVTPPGWAADGKGGCRWSFLPEDNPASAFDILGFKILA